MHVQTHEPIEQLIRLRRLKSHDLSNRIFADQDALWDGCVQAWNRLDPQRLARVCHTQ